MPWCRGVDIANPGYAGADTSFLPTANTADHRKRQYNQYRKLCGHCG
jgi:hypothetical protein